MSDLDMRRKLSPLYKEFPRYSFGVGWTNPNSGPGVTYYWAKTPWGLVRALSMEALAQLIREQRHS